MNLAVLYSGGKDSNMALLRAVESGHSVSVLLNMVSRNPESYMFHTPALEIVPLQAECLELPLLRHETEGRKEEELKDLKELIREGIEKFGIEGVVTGAVKSIYQAERIQRVCKDLDIWVFSPLWLKDERELAETEAEEMEIIISAVAAAGLGKEWIGKPLSQDIINELARLGISPTGEGGEFETIVLDSPLFKKRIAIESYDIEWDGMSGRMKNPLFRVEEK